ncbi:nucleotidyltransferase family protein [Gilvimarinus sp. SDUM040013]|uniref:Nucleotidyltransferase family protein n=1 Tax=Gilvimarinus gilvus TaxID=3058038 RepID=A0ABU4RWI8_9GAMM|nr:nucleotidyltransferase family protein [Gilvimarinus sp. SDUM040013]MDO3385258.1 nucleotidyltransferase family protein [Gilvimarinus sp. SDUM040013]MDX6849241.1 nucleotidyltransferase family protein [Gilvimarinus sp. SDUM040013]
MKAMILAAGLGKRMRPLTDTLPKPLIPVRGKPLIEWHLERLSAAGVSQVLINIAYLGQKIRDAVGDGSRWGLEVAYSEEPEPLETAGAIHYAASWLGSEPFLLVNADVYTDIEFEPLLAMTLAERTLGHLVLVPNPEFKARGDFDLSCDLVTEAGDSTGFTFAGVSVLKPELISTYPNARRVFPLVEVLHWALAQQRLTGEVFRGRWSDVGTPERLRLLGAGKMLF